jgi:hypothetical protein
MTTEATQQTDERTGGTTHEALQAWVDEVAAMTTPDRIVHHADVIALKGASYRLRHRGLDTLPSIKAEQESLN